MHTNLRSSAVAAVTLALVLTLVLGLLTSPRESAVAVEPEPAADSPDQYVWTVVYRIATKPEGETVAVPMGAPHQIKVLYTYVKEFQVRPDGTFAFQDCDFGFCRQEDAFETNKLKIHSRTNWQGLLRGSGKWQAATADADEKLTLTLEWGAGDGATETQTEGDDKTYVRYAASPDGRTLTTTSEIPGGKPIIYSYPNPFIASEWTLKPNQVAPEDSSRGAHQGPGLNGIPVSLMSAAKDECEDKKEQKFEGGRPTTLICAAGPRTPVTESVEVTKKEKKADVGVSIGGWEAGSSGTVKVGVYNNGPCEGHMTLVVNVAAGDLDVRPTRVADGTFEVLSHRDGFTKVTSEKRKGFVGYSFVYEFTLAKDGSETVEISAKDTTPPGQTLPYKISFFAWVHGSLPDPNHRNNGADWKVSFDPPKKTPARPTPSKPK